MNLFDGELNSTACNRETSKVWQFARGEKTTLGNARSQHSCCCYSVNSIQAIGATPPKCSAFAIHLQSGLIRLLTIQSFRSIVSKLPRCTKTDAIRESVKETALKLLLGNFTEPTPSLHEPSESLCPPVRLFTEFGCPEMFEDAQRCY